MKILQLFKQGQWTTYCLVLPMFFMYLLPISLKGKLNLLIANIPFSLCNVSLLLIFLCFFRYRFKSVFNKPILYLYLCYLLFVNIPLCFDNYNYTTFFNDICVGLTLPILMFFQTKISTKWIACPTFKVLIFVLFSLISVEMILVDLGLLQLGSDKVIIEDTEGVLRFSTTVGAPTATAGVLLILGACLFALLNSKKWKTIFLFFWLFSIMLTLSRGSFFGVFLFAIYYLGKNYIDKKKLAKSVIYITIFGSIIIFSGVLTPIIERTEVRSANDNDKFTGRTEFWNKAIRLWSSGNIFIGRGVGNVQPRTGQNEFSKNYTLPHNSYILLLSEQGIVGAALLLYIFINICRATFRSRNRDNFILLCIILLSVLNSETILFFEVFALPFTYFVRLITFKYETCNNR